MTYVTVNEADTYFETRLHSQLWAGSNPVDKVAALLEASDRIDQLNYIGYKNPVYLLYQTNSCPTAAQIAAADATQARQFPRGVDTEVPEDIKIACYEIAYELLDGVDPEEERENLNVVSQGFGSIRATYDRGFNQEHLHAGIPSHRAWVRIRKYLRDNQGIQTHRV